MGNVLDLVSSDNTTFTIFENDQVLTADQLNDLFNYLDVQTRITRSKAIGVGIITGLEIGVLANKQIVVSKGAAITTDGDMLYFNSDQQFDQYQLFEDTNAKYPYFRNGNDVITMYELLSSNTPNSTGLALDGFETATSTSIKDYVGVLYLEDYDNDPDICTGLDCDNKGQVAVKNLKMLLVDKADMNQLLQSIPAVNANYFSLDDMVAPRVTIKNTISSYAELTAAFNAVVTSGFKDEIKSKLGTAFQVCRDIVADQFNGVDPTTDWNNLLDSYFNNTPALYVQYLYDFERDISYAYNELRESLFTGNVIASPDVQLFPKHVLLGLVTDAALGSPQVPPSSPVSGNNLFNSNLFLRPIRFDISLLIRRFLPIHIDINYRHPFYESPVLNQDGESIDQTKFCFMRIHSLIHNFKILTTADTQNTDSGIKITPSRFEDKRLGERSIPFYYNINAAIPANVYWSFDANVRVKENEILSYSSGQYATKPSVLNPLQFNLFPYNFFRIEGHIGFSHIDVENKLNQIISDNNLPINIVSVQVEKIVETIPTRPWYFPHLQVYENFVRDTFADHMNQVDLVHTTLQAQLATQPAEVVPPETMQSINVGIQSFSNSKTNVLKYNPLSQEILTKAPDTGRETYNANFFTNYKADVKSVIDSATDVKALTKDFTFSNAATPHDFVINTDILHKVDNLSDQLIQNITIKKQGLMLGNFLTLNPGLDHAGGVVSGGTFILAYTSADNIVVADFMLPYASIDKDIVVNPPVFKPLEVIPKLDLPKVLEVVPHYVDEINKLTLPFVKTADIDTMLSAKVATKFDDLSNNLDVKLASQAQVVNSQFAIRDTQIDTISKSNSTLINHVLNVPAIAATGGLNTGTVVTRGPILDTPVSDGPVASGPVASGPVISEGPVASGPIAEGPIASGPVASGPIVSGPIASGPISAGGGISRGGVIARGPILAPGLRLAGRDFAPDLQVLHTQQKELVKLKSDDPKRHAKESKILNAAKTLTDHLNAPGIAADPENAVYVKSMLSDIHAITGMIHSKTLKSKATAISKKANAINAKFIK